MAKHARTTTHEHAADSILALINSRPRSPTKAELMACLAGWELIDSAANDNDGPSPWKPSDLGQRLMDNLPRWAVAVQADYAKNDVRGSPDYIGREACEQIEDRCLDVYNERDAIRDAILDRIADEPGNIARHLVDLALVINIDDNNLTLEEMDGEQIAKKTIVLAVLAMAGIDAEDWTMTAHCDQVEARLETEARVLG